MPASKTPAPRVLWKGAISFGLVHIPVALYSATVDHSIDFDWLDKRSMDPVGYKRVNKKTGKEIAREQIVKGIEYEDGQYVVLSDEEIADAYPKTTQTIEIETFVPADSIPFVYLERPYYVAPINRGGKVYALLRETLQRSGRVGVARVVIQTKQHLAALVPVGPGPGAEPAALGRRHPALERPAAAGREREEGRPDRARTQDGDATGRRHELRLGPRRLQGLVQGRDHAAGRQKVEAGQTEEVTKREPVEEGRGRPSAKILDLTELLQRSLRKGGKAAADRRGQPRRASPPPRAAPASARRPKTATRRKAA